MGFVFSPLSCVLGLFIATAFVAPGATLPDGACLPPLSSSHELADAAPEHRAFCRAAFPPPPASLQLLVGLPSIAFVHA